MNPKIFVLCFLLALPFMVDAAVQLQSQYVGCAAYSGYSNCTIGSLSVLDSSIYNPTYVYAEMYSGLFDGKVVMIKNGVTSTLATITADTGTSCFGPVGTTCYGGTKIKVLEDSSYYYVTRFVVYAYIGAAYPSTSLAIVYKIDKATLVTSTLSSTTFATQNGGAALGGFYHYDAHLYNGRILVAATGSYFGPGALYHTSYFEVYLNGTLVYPVVNLGTVAAGHLAVSSTGTTAHLLGNPIDARNYTDYTLSSGGAITSYSYETYLGVGVSSNAVRWPSSTGAWISTTNIPGNYEIYADATTRLTTTSSDELLLDSIESGADLLVVWRDFAGEVLLTKYCAGGILSDDCSVPIASTYPDVYLKVFDDGCCLSGCTLSSDSYGPCTLNRDWLHAEYYVDGVAYGSGDGASCNISRSGTAYQMTYANATSPNGDYNWNYMTPWDGSWAGNQVAVICAVNNITNSQAIAFFKVQDTTGLTDAFANVGSHFEADDLCTGIFPTTDLQSTFQTFCMKITGNSQSSSRYSRNYACLLSLPEDGVIDADANLDYYDQETAPDRSVYADIGGVPLTVGYAPFNMKCSARPISGSNYYRVPSFFIQSSVEVTQGCDTLQDSVVDVNYLRSTYYEGEAINPEIKYSTLSDVTHLWETISSATCDWTLTGSSSSSGSTDGYDSVDLSGLSAGSYNFSVDCSFYGSSQCIAPAWKTRSFTVVASSCAGTELSCGTGSTKVYKYNSGTDSFNDSFGWNAGGTCFTQVSRNSGYYRVDSKVYDVNATGDLEVHVCLGNPDIFQTGYPDNCRLVSTVLASSLANETVSTIGTVIPTTIVNTLCGNGTGTCDELCVAYYCPNCTASNNYKFYFDLTGTSGRSYYMLGFNQNFWTVGEGELNVNLTTQSTCQVCPTETRTCEDGAEIVVEPLCLQGVTCDADWGSAQAECDKNHQIYTLTASTNRDTTPCNMYGLEAYGKLLKLGKEFEISELGKIPSCYLSIANTNLTAYYTMKWDATSRRFTWIAKDNKIPTLSCGAKYRLDLSCCSDAFGLDGECKDTSIWVTLASGGVCTSLDGITYSAGMCKVDVTGNDLDRPLYCSSASGVYSETNNSVICGCPNGMTANATTTSCDGSPSINFSLDWFNYWWLIVFIVFIPLIGYVYTVFIK